MKHFFLLVLLCVCACRGIAQADNANLLVQSPDGKTVKLLWFVKGGKAGAAGFDIKRKEGLGPWVKLNSAPIAPGIGARKSLAPAEADNLEQGRLREKLADLLRTGKLKETDNAAYLQKLNSNDKDIQDINALMSTDYDVALLCGFGYVDHTATQKTNYKYGLFAQGSEILLDEVGWNYGEIPDLNVVREITSRPVQGNGGIEVMWSADAVRMKDGYVAGFNIYRQGIRLNERPIVAVSSKEPGEFVWTDRRADAGTASQYSISAQSLMGIEGIIKPYTYNPADHPAGYRKAEVTQMASIGYYFKEGLNVQWSFPKDQERFVKGFYVEKDNMPEGYVQVSKLVDAGERAYVDRSASAVSGYIRARVVTVYKDKTVVPGVERLYSYFPIRNPPPPLNTKLKTEPGDKKLTLKLSWDSRMSGDSQTHGYKVYMTGPDDRKFALLTAKPIKANSYNYTLQQGTAATYMLYVTGESAAQVEGQPGDTVMVHAPSLELPTPTISRAELEGSNGRIYWQYDEPQDLKGYRLYNNGVLVANEAVLARGAKMYLTTELVPGVINIYTLVAVTEGGVVSAASAGVQLVMPVVEKAPVDYR